jgi:hypothetical protein
MTRTNVISSGSLDLDIFDCIINCLSLSREYFTNKQVYLSERTGRTNRTAANIEELEKVTVQRYIAGNSMLAVWNGMHEIHSTNSVKTLLGMPSLMATFLGLDTPELNDLLTLAYDSIEIPSYNTKATRNQSGGYDITYSRARKRTFTSKNWTF